jgi:hypothetical protein
MQYTQSEFADDVATTLISRLPERAGCTSGTHGGEEM